MKNVYGFCFDIDRQIWQRSLFVRSFQSITPNRWKNFIFLNHFLMCYTCSLRKKQAILVYLRSVLRNGGWALQIQTPQFAHFTTSTELKVFLRYRWGAGPWKAGKGLFKGLQCCCCWGFWDSCLFLTTLYRSPFAWLTQHPHYQPPPSNTHLTSFDSDSLVETR